MTGVDDCAVWDIKKGCCDHLGSLKEIFFAIAMMYIHIMFSVSAQDNCFKGSMQPASPVAWQQNVLHNLDTYISKWHYIVYSNHYNY